MGITCQIRDFVELKNSMENMAKDAPRKVLKATTVDAKKRVPGWVASEIVKEYGVKKTEITGEKIGTVRTKGDNVQELKFYYEGWLLTPTHFGMKPTSPNVGRAYTLKATIIKGQRKTLSKVKKLTKKQWAALSQNFHGGGARNSPQSPYMLQKTGAKSADKTQYIPFQRRGQPGKMRYVMRTVSLPQMVSGDRTKEGIQAAINDGLSKRLDHHMNRFMGK